jgi:5-dehydro-2-deoxygluconokinase
MPVERPGSRPLAFEPPRSLALEMRAWPAEHVAKCLVSYHPHDPPALREAQQRRLLELQEASVGTGHEFLVELVPPRELPLDERTLADAMAQIYEAGVKPDWWKLPPSLGDAAWEAIAAVIQRHDPLCRGVLILGMEASEENLDRSFRVAAPHAVCKGFAVGRSIFADAAQAWFQGGMSDEAVVADIAGRYRSLIARWDQARAGVGAATAI